MRLWGKANAMANTSRKETKPFTSPLEEMKAPTQSLIFRRRDGCFTVACVFHMHLLQRYDMFCVLYEVIFRNSRTNSGECAFCFMHLSVLSLIDCPVSAPHFTPFYCAIYCSHSNGIILDS